MPRRHTLASYSEIRQITAHFGQIMLYFRPVYALSGSLCAVSPLHTVGVHCVSPTHAGVTFSDHLLTLHPFCTPLPHPKRNRQSFALSCLAGRRKRRSGSSSGRHSSHIPHTSHADTTPQPVLLATPRITARMDGWMVGLHIPDTFCSHRK